MAADLNQGTCPCNMPGFSQYTQLTFPDGIRVRVKGLIKLFEAVYREGKKPDRSIAEELVTRLSENNYIASGAWREYETLVLQEYRKFFEAREESRSWKTP